MRNIAVFLLLAFICSCAPKNPNITEDGTDILEKNLETVEIGQQNVNRAVYVPIYSEIYLESKLKTTLLSAILSIRSTSLKDTTYIEKLDYYDNDGTMIKSFIDGPLLLGPMQSIDYVIDRDDASGGLGANFHIEWGAKKDTKPIFQAVMIGLTGNQGFSFVAEGREIDL